MGVFKIKLSYLLKRDRARKEGKLHTKAQTVQEWLDKGNEITILPYAFYNPPPEPFVPRYTFLESDYI